MPLRLDAPERFRGSDEEALDGGWWKQHSDGEGEVDIVAGCAFNNSTICKPRLTVDEKDRSVERELALEDLALGVLPLGRLDYPLGRVDSRGAPRAKRPGPDLPEPTPVLRIDLFHQL